MKLKNLFPCLIMAAMVVFNVSCNDDVKSSDVPTVVMTTFQKMFPNTTAQWEKEKHRQLKAEFYFNYHEMEVWLQNDGTWVRTKKDISISELPQKTLDYLDANYKSVEVDDVDWVESPTEKYYLVELDRDNRKDIYLKFSEAGELIH
ncbi:MAG: PepSY-like domain-containing protein [Bacteroidaceae bacterium]|nr:PepSY-like domain-containing protein [Bacteroidaceae bacterium]